jgi:hypothetical protein
MINYEITAFLNGEYLEMYHIWRSHFDGAVPLYIYICEVIIPVSAGFSFFFLVSCGGVRQSIWYVGH